jgi:hypothetical protein
MSRAAANILSDAAKQLMSHWELTRADWRDQKAVEFHESFLSQIPDLVTKSNATINEVEALLRKVRSDCAEHQQ